MESQDKSCVGDKEISLALKCNSAILYVVLGFSTFVSSCKHSPSMDSALDGGARYIGYSSDEGIDDNWREKMPELFYDFTVAYEYYSPNIYSFYTCATTSPDDVLTELEYHCINPFRHNGEDFVFESREIKHMLYASTYLDAYIMKLRELKKESGAISEEVYAQKLEKIENETMSYILLRKAARAPTYIGFILDLKKSSFVKNHYAPLIELVSLFHKDRKAYDRETLAKLQYDFAVFLNTLLLRFYSNTQKSYKPINELCYRDLDGTTLCKTLDLAKADKGKLASEQRCNWLLHVLYIKRNPHCDSE